jgi:hypothetical protein
MGDSTDSDTSGSETSQNDFNDEKFAREQLLGESYLSLDEGTISWIANNIDCFVSQSRGNVSVREVILQKHAFNGHGDDVWDKVGQAVGNLQALETLRIIYYKNHDVDSPTLVWEILGRILSRVRQKIKVVLDSSDDWAVGEVQALGRAIRGHPTITYVETCYNLPYESMDSFYAALATLPALESVKLTLLREIEDVMTLAQHESLTELLRVPSLRSVNFTHFDFTPALCQATANALIEGTAITKLMFSRCTFSAGECAAIMASGFRRNTSVSSIQVDTRLDQALCNALASALPSNSSLRHLDLSTDFSPVFSALGQNTGLKSLKVNLGWMDETLCTAMKDGLEMNETLESLELNSVHLIDDNSALWCRAFSFLHTNKTLKSLLVHVYYGESCLSAFRINIVAMLQENASLESITFKHTTFCKGRIEADEYVALVTALQHNTKLKSLSFHGHSTIRLTDYEDKQMASLVKKNYALESLSNICWDGDVGVILRLNGAGRRYLVQDGSSISKGVEVLSRVHNEINCIFLHLLENPRLCDRSAVEILTGAAESNGRSTSPNASSGGGKREQASAHKGKESRRRLA